jgi:hypothetical protein
MRGIRLSPQDELVTDRLHIAVARTESSTASVELDTDDPGAVDRKPCFVCLTGSDYIDAARVERAVAPLAAENFRIPVKMVGQLSCPECALVVER